MSENHYIRFLDIYGCLEIRYVINVTYLQFLLLWFQWTPYGVCRDWMKILWVSRSECCYLIRNNSRILTELHFVCRLQCLEHIWLRLTMLSELEVCSILLFLVNHFVGEFWFEQSLFKICPPCISLVSVHSTVCCMPLTFLPRWWECHQ